MLTIRRRCVRFMKVPYKLGQYEWATVQVEKESVKLDGL